MPARPGSAFSFSAKPVEFRQQASPLSQQQREEDAAQSTAESVEMEQVVLAFALVVGKKIIDENSVKKLEEARTSVMALLCRKDF